MKLIVFPALVFAFFSGYLALEKAHTTDTIPSALTVQADQAGQTFVAYRNAVATFLKNNPAFVGTVSASQLSAQGTPFSSVFMSLASNKITAAGVAGRIVTCYASLPPGALSSASVATGYDASLGTASGGNWSSIAAGATAQPLATAVTSGSIVSVIQVGR